MTKRFTKNDSLAVKGTAILILLWHHCFLEGRYPGTGMSFFPFTESQVVNIAYFFKICVSIFAFISGFGLYQSLRKTAEVPGTSRSVTKWYLQRYVKSFSGFWLIVVLVWILEQAIDGRTAAAYFQEGRLRGICYMLFQILGLSNLFGTPTIQWEWWYMTAALVFIILAPVFYYGLDKIGSIGCMAVMLLFPRCFGQYPGGMHFLSFVPAFLLGMIFAKEELFSKLEGRINGSGKRLCAGILLFVVLTFACYKITMALPRQKFWDLELGLMPGIYITLIYLTVCKIPGLKTAFRWIGKYSADIYLIHELFHSVYARNLVYSSGHFFLSILTLLALSLAAALCIEGLKRLIRFPRLVDGLLTKI